MNEITKIHLGRTAFTIAVDAHKALQEYLRAIKRHMGDSDEAVEEVELRMAELLTERGVTGRKVILLKDIDYLKSQLGEPGDFGDEQDKEVQHEDAPPSKRLFRDTDNAMIAGVAAGLGKYFAMDPLWIRLAFVGLTFAGATGIVMYIILWLIVPEAKTTSDRLQMQGKSVTVDSLKDVMERADIKGAAERAGNTVGKVVQGVFAMLARMIGAMLAVVGTVAAMVLLALGTYLIIHGSQVGDQVIFPVGVREVTVVVLAMTFGIIAAAVIAFAGGALVKGRQLLRGWAAWVLLILFVGAGSVGTALALDAVPRVSDRINQAEQHLSDGACKENIFRRCVYYHVP